MSDCRAVNVAYRYDGSLAGFYCCVFESFSRNEMPLDISIPSDQVDMLDMRWVDTNQEYALRVREGIIRRISQRALELAETVFYSSMASRELALLRFLRPAFKAGPAYLSQLSDPLLAPLLSAEGHLRGECHLLCGFARFIEVGGRLASTIGPKNFVLPFLSEHFSERFANETFIIYDETHQSAMIHEPWQQATIARMEQPPSFAISDEEAYYQALWRQFHETIGISQRANPTCQRSHMPKRYWGYMTEMRCKTASMLQTSEK